MASRVEREAGGDFGRGRGRLQPADRARTRRGRMRASRPIARSSIEPLVASTAAAWSSSRATALGRVRERGGCGRVRGRDPARHGGARSARARGPPAPLPDRHQPGRHHPGGGRHLRRRRERRRRLEGLAEPGGICIAGSVYNRSRASWTSPSCKGGTRSRTSPSRSRPSAWRSRGSGGTGGARPGAAGRRATRWLVPTAGALVALAVLRRGLALLASRAAARGRARDRGAAVRQPGRGRGDGAARGRDHRGHHHRPRPLPRLDVIARNSTEVYKGKPVDIRQVGKDLNVDYVLEGSIERQDDSVRYRPADRRRDRRARLVGALGPTGRGHLRRADRGGREGRRRPWAAI